MIFFFSMHIHKVISPTRALYLKLSQVSIIIFLIQVVSESEMIAQNRRLLPEETSNPLHIVDYEDRYFIGIIDFFTRYTFKKKLENAYKSVIYKKLSFSTVHPKIFRRRFIKYWEDHTEWCSSFLSWAVLILDHKWMDIMLSGDFVIYRVVVG